MSEAVQLKHLEERVGNLLAEADRLAADGSLPPDVPWPPAFEQFRAQARLVLDKARAPVKIGVVGEFSAGKTLLLGGLIGYADALPVKEIATTGNVTALRFIPVEGLATTEIDSYEIDFLSHAGFEECLAYMLEQARRRALSAELREDLRDKLAAIKGNDPQAPSKVEEWARAAWSTTNPALKYSIRELVRFVRAYLRCGAGLCDGDPFTVSAEHATRGLELDSRSDNIQSAAYSEIPTPTHTISSRPASLTAEQIRDAFPLIRLVTVEVKLSAGVWDFSGLGADRFILMDFPGLGADSSGVRDLFLCLRELEKVQTLLILLNGRKPGGDQGIKIYNLLQENRAGQDVRDMVLVGVGRFDQLPLGSEGKEKLRALTGLAAQAASQPAPKKKRGGFDEEEEDDAPPARPTSSPTVGPLTESALLDALPILGSAVAGAEALVPPGRSDRIVFLSPLLYLKRLEEKNVGLQVGSDEFMANARKDVEEGLALRPLWSEVAKKLQPTAGARSRPLLADWLGDFAEDGGIARLRALIQSHVQGAGFGQLLKDVLRLRQDLDVAQQEFREALPPVQSGKDVRTADDKIAAGENYLRQLTDFYQHQANRLRAVPRLTLTVDSITRPLEDYLHEEVVFRIDDWPLWDTLMQHSKDGYIREKVATAKARRIFGDDDEEDEEETAFPTRSEDFFPPFEQTAQQLRKYTLELIDRGVAEYLARLGPEVEAARLTLATPLERKSLPKEIRAMQLGERGKELVGALRVSVAPTKLRTGLFRTDDAPEDAPPESAADLPLPALVPANLFPLARSTREAPGRVFGWAARFQDAAADARPEAHLSHQAMVLRIRDEMVRLLLQEMSQLLSEGTQLVLDRLTEKLDTMVSKLGVASSNRFVLETILTEPAAQGAVVAATDQLLPFRRLASANLT